MNEKLTEEQNDYIQKNITDPKTTLSKAERKNFLSGFLSGVLLMALVFGGVYIGKQLYTLYLYQQTSARNTTDRKEVLTADTEHKMQVIEDMIYQYYLEEVDSKDLQDGIYYGMVDALNDPYSTYYSEEDLEEFKEDTQGIYYGIGAYIGTNQDTNMCVISGVIEDTPAEAAGLRPGDIIYKVDGVSTQGLSSTEVVSFIKGEENTTVHLTLIREEETDFLEVDVERKQIETPTVKYEMKENGIGYLQITEFDSVTTDQFAEAYAVLKESGMKALVIDLRSNPGGSLSVVCDIARKLLPKGLIVYTEDKYGKRNEYACDGRNEIEVPLAVLVNGYSASASEILAGAIKDYGIGTLIGTKTFGKGIVQSVLSLSDNSALKLTVSKYYTPNGKNIHGVGIEPDIVVEYDADAYVKDGVDNQLEEAVQYIRGQIGE